MRVTKNPQGVVHAFFTEEISLTQVVSFCLELQESDTFSQAHAIILDFLDCFNLEHLDSESLLDTALILSHSHPKNAPVVLLSHALKFTPTCEHFLEQSGCDRLGHLNVFIDKKEALQWIAQAFVKEPPCVESQDFSPNIFSPQSFTLNATTHTS